MCPLNSKNDTEGPGANSRDITLVRTGGRGSWGVGEGERVGGWVGERERESNRTQYMTGIINRSCSS